MSKPVENSVRVNRKKPNKIKAAIIGFMQTIAAPTQHPPELQKFLKKVDDCTGHCVNKIEHLVKTAGE